MASDVWSSPAANNLACSSHASGLDWSSSRAFSTDSRATGTSPSSISLAARSVQPAALVGSLEIGSTSVRISCARLARSAILTSCSVAALSMPRASSRRRLRTTLSISVPERRSVCSCSTSTSSGSIASNLSKLRSSASTSPSSRWIVAKDRRAEASSEPSSWARR